MGRIGTLPFAINEVMPEATLGTGALDHLLGSVYEADDGKVFQLVQASSMTNFDARGKMLKFVSRSAFTVTPCAAITDDVAGVVPYRNPLIPGAAALTSMVGLSSVDTDDYLLVQIRGRVEVIQGDDVSGDPGAANATQMFVTPGDDADTGKIEGRATWVIPSTAKIVARFVAVYSGAADTDNSVYTVDLDRDGIL